MTAEEWPADLEHGRPVRGITLNDERRISSERVREALGISPATLARWQKDPEIGMPQPVKIGLKLYWRESDLCAWLQKKQAEADAAAEAARESA